MTGCIFHFSHVYADCYPESQKHRQFWLTQSQLKDPIQVLILDNTKSRQQPGMGHYKVHCERVTNEFKASAQRGVRRCGPGATCLTRSVAGSHTAKSRVNSCHNPRTQTHSTGRGGVGVSTMSSICSQPSHADTLHREGGS